MLQKGTRLRDSLHVPEKVGWGEGEGVEQGSRLSTIYGDLGPVTR